MVKGRKFTIEQLAKNISIFDTNLKDRSNKKRNTKKKRRMHTMSLQQKFQSDYYPLLRTATVITFLLMMIISIILMYGVANFYGFDISNQISTAAVLN